jgi:undecaprenyl pyrophosphate phosphatase UppP
MGGCDDRSDAWHLILASRLLGLTQTDFQKSFEIAIQLGAIASVILLYWRRFLEPTVLGSRLIQTQNAMMAARTTADKKLRASLS